MGAEWQFGLYSGIAHRNTQTALSPKDGALIPEKGRSWTSAGWVGPAIFLCCTFPLAFGHLDSWTDGWKGGGADIENILPLIKLHNSPKEELSGASPEGAHRRWRGLPMSRSSKGEDTSPTNPRPPIVHDLGGGAHKHNRMCVGAALSSAWSR